MFDRIFSEADAALDRFLRSSDSKAVEIDHEILLDAFRGGYSLDNLARLLQADSLPAVQSGAMIASELGIGAAPLVRLFGRLLAHEDRFVRASGMDCVLVCNDGDPAADLVALVELMDHPDAAIRWSAFTAVSRLSTVQLEAIMSQLTTGPEALRHLPGIAMLLGRKSPQVTPESDLLRVYEIIDQVRSLDAGTAIEFEKLQRNSVGIDDPALKDFVSYALEDWSRRERRRQKRTKGQDNQDRSH